MEDRSCPLPTHDIEVNLKNRNYAFEHYGYGPANPEEPNKVFWLKKARRGRSSGLMASTTPDTLGTDTTLGAS